MIQSFKDGETRRLFETGSSRLWSGVRAIAVRKLDQLEGAVKLSELRVPPGNRLEGLKGERLGQHSIRINDQYRICFVWKADGAHEVQIVDYHEAEMRVRRMTYKRPAGGWSVKRVTTHPGEMLRGEFLEPMGITQNGLAMKIRVPATRVGDIVHGRRAITPDTALRLARFFGTSAEFWLNLQQRHDLSKARIEVGGVIEREVEVNAGVDLASGQYHDDGSAGDHEPACQGQRG